MVQAAMRPGKDNPMAKKAATNSRKANPAAKKAVATSHTNTKTFGLKDEAPKKAIAKWNDPYNPDHRYAPQYKTQYEAALKGNVPPPPDFSAPTHARHRGKLAKLVALVEKRDVSALRAILINPVSSSPQAMLRYRNIAIIALEAQAKKRAAEVASRDVLRPSQGMRPRLGPRSASSTQAILIGEETSLDVFRPSQGMLPSFGRRQVTTDDSVHYLYLMKLKGDLSAMMGRPWHSLVGKSLVKVGYSNDPIRRCEELNAAFPPAGQFEWRLATLSKEFRDGASAKAAEDQVKAEFDRAFESLGGEFFFGPESRIESAFNRIAVRRAD
jgi:hypothetical protein